MKKVRKSSQFKKDFKRIVHDQQKVQDLLDTVKKYDKVLDTISLVRLGSHSELFK